MSEHTNIEWTDHTFNPWIGCTKVSPGCAHCYAETLMDTRYGRVKWGAGQPRVRTSAANWKQPLRWNRAACEGPLPGDDPLRRPRVFCASLADWLDDEVPIEWLADLLALVAETPMLDWLLLTKRPQNWRARLSAVVRMKVDEGAKAIDQCSGIALAAAWLNGAEPSNVWSGTTVEDQARAEERLPEIVEIPARVKFLSCEPLLEQLDLSYWLTDPLVPQVQWVIVGGESGPCARPMQVEWADDLRRQCAQAGVSFFMKQLGARVGLRDRKGGDIADFPAELRVREFPT